MFEQFYLYSLLYEYYEKFGICKYGFYGILYKYVIECVVEFFGCLLKDLCLIFCYFGNGVSIVVVEGGKLIDIFMGFMLFVGVVMGICFGNIDFVLILYIMEKIGQIVDEVLNILNKKSGLFGIFGFLSDFCDIVEVMKEGNECVEIVFEVFVSRIYKYIGFYVVRMSGVDVIIFIVGIGENSVEVRECVFCGLEFMGVYWDFVFNNVCGEEVFISYLYFLVKVMIILIDEEVMIVCDVVCLVK